MLKTAITSTIKKALFLSLILLIVAVLPSGIIVRTYTPDIYTEDRYYVMNTENKVYSPDTDTIEYSMTYTGNEWGSFGERFYLSKLVDGEWKIISYEMDTPIEDIASIVESGEIVSAKFCLEKYYIYPLEKGQYRLINIWDQSDKTAIKSNIFAIK